MKKEVKNLKPKKATQVPLVSSSLTSSPELAKAVAAPGNAILKGAVVPPPSTISYFFILYQ